MKKRQGTKGTWQSEATTPLWLFFASYIQPKASLPPEP